MSRKTTKLAWLLFLISFLIRLLLINTNFWKTPDAVEYLNLSQHLIQGQGLTTSIKIHFFNSQPVVHSALAERPIGFSLFLAPLLLIHNSPQFIQLCLLLLNSINTCLFFFFLSRLFKPPWPFFGALFFALNPNILISNRLIMPEPVYFFFILLSLIFFYRSSSTGNLFFSGFLLGLAYLVRPESLFLVFGLSLLLVLKKQFPPLLPFYLGLFLLAFPYHFLNYYQTHHFFSVMELYDYRVRHFSVGMNNFQPSLPSITTFIRANLGWIFQQQLKNLGLHFRSLISLTWLGLLFPFIFFSSRRFLQRHFFLVIFGLASFALVVFTWAIFAEPERMLFIPFVTFLPFCLEGLSRVKSRRLISLILLITLISYLGYDSHRLIWAKWQDVPAQNFPYNQTLAKWFKTQTSAEAVIASPDPWLISLTTARPSLMLPKDLNQDNCQEFIQTYQVDYLLSEQTLDWFPVPPVFKLDSPPRFIYSVP
jgi:hypothetical protein